MRGCERCLGERCVGSVGGWIQELKEGASSQGTLIDPSWELDEWSGFCRMWWMRHMQKLLRGIEACHKSIAHPVLLAEFSRCSF